MRVYVVAWDLPLEDIDSVFADYEGAKARANFLHSRNGYHFGVWEYELGSVPPHDSEIWVTAREPIYRTKSGEGKA